MKRLLVIVLVLVVAGGALGYWRGWFSVTNDGNGVQTDAAKLKDDQAAFIKTVGEKAKALKDQVAGLRKKSERLTDADKTQVQMELGELTKKHDRLEQQIKDLEDAGSGRFVSIKEDLSKTLADVEKKIEELTKKLEKSKDT
jgi:chromosome segregation ATPase